MGNKVNNKSNCLISNYKDERIRPRQKNQSYNNSFIMEDINNSLCKKYNPIY